MPFDPHLLLLYHRALIAGSRPLDTAYCPLPKSPPSLSTTPFISFIYDMDISFSYDASTSRSDGIVSLPKYPYFGRLTSLEIAFPHQVPIFLTIILISTLRKKTFDCERVQSIGDLSHHYQWFRADSRHCHQCLHPVNRAHCLDPFLAPDHRPAPQGPFPHIKSLPTVVPPTKPTPTTLSPHQVTPNCRPAHQTDSPDPFPTSKPLPTVVPPIKPTPTADCPPVH